MSGLLSEIDWSIIVILIVVSVVVAWVGDVVGMKLGKKRITIFNLRPKYTSRIISVLTGIGIAFATLFVSAMASESVRTAIFNMKYVRAQISTLTAELKENQDKLSNLEYQLFENKGKLKEKQEKLSSVEKELSAGTEKLQKADKKLGELEKTKDQLVKSRDSVAAEHKQLSKEVSGLKNNIASLNDEANSLKTNVQHLREGRIAAFSGEILAQGIIASSSKLTDKQIDDAIDRLSAECKVMLADRFGISVSNIDDPKINKESLEKVKAELKKNTGRYLVRISALSNAIAGEPVSTEVSVYPTKLVYKKGTLLDSIKFNSGQSRSEIELKISEALKSINKKAVKDGVLREPISGTVGSIDSTELSAAIKKVAGSATPCTLQLRTSRDIYTEGPVTLKVSVISL